MRLPLVLAAAVSLAASAAHANVPLETGLGGPRGFGAQCMSPNDDGSTNAIDITPAFPNGLRFFGRTYRTFFVNTNGNITFNDALPTYTPSAFPIANEPMIAPYWADVDIRVENGSCMGGAGTSSPGNGPCINPADDGVWWTLEPGRVVVTWHMVGYFGCHIDKRMNFQLILSVPPGGADGDFDVEFRYNRCEWTTGDASGGSGGFGGTPAQAGFDAGNLHDFLALPGSLSMDILHVCDRSNIGQPGRWLFQVRNGNVTPCDIDAGTCFPSPVDAGPDACFGTTCYGNPLLIEGRAGPIGDCSCRIAGHATENLDRRGVALGVFAAGVFFARRKFRSRRR